MKNFIKANLEDLKGVLEFTMENDNIIQITFLVNGKEYLIKKEGIYTDNLVVLVKQLPQQYRVVATITTDFHPLTEEQVFGDIKDAEQYKRELEDKCSGLEYVKDFKVEIVNEDMVEGN